MAPAKPSVPPCGKFRVDGGTGWPVNGRRDPAKLLDILKTFRRVGTSGGTR